MVDEQADSKAYLYLGEVLRKEGRSAYPDEVTSLWGLVGKCSELRSRRFNLERSWQADVYRQMQEAYSNKPFAFRL